VTKYSKVRGNCGAKCHCSKCKTPLMALVDDLDPVEYFDRERNARDVIRAAKKKLSALDDPLGSDALDPDEYHKEHGICPDGYHYDEDTDACVETKHAGNSSPNDAFGALSREDQTSLWGVSKELGDLFGSGLDEKETSKKLMDAAELFRKGGGNGTGRLLEKVAERGSHEQKIALGKKVWNTVKDL